MPSTPRSSRSQPSPRDTIKLGRKTIKVGDEVTVSAKLVAIWPDLNGREQLTIQLSNGNRETLPKTAFEAE